MIAWKLPTVLTLLSIAVPSEAAPDKVAEASVKQNVVSLTSEWEDGRRENGFGIIVGEDDEFLYIVTANHVVRGRFPGDKSKQIRIDFPSASISSVFAELLPVSDPRKDLGILRAVTPSEFSLQRHVLPANGGIKRGDEVVYIGRGGEWYIPAEPGRVNTPRTLEEEIVVDGLNVRVGTSGGPLVSADGVVGMIVSQESDGVVHALHIDYIARFMGHHSLPWDLEAVSRRDADPFGEPRRMSARELGATAYSISPDGLLRGGSRPRYVLDDVGSTNTRFEVLARPGRPYQLMIRFDENVEALAALRIHQAADSDVRSFLKDARIFYRSDPAGAWQEVDEVTVPQQIVPYQVDLDLSDVVELRLELISAWGQSTVTVGKIEFIVY